VVRDMAGDPRITVTGYVDDIRGYVGRAQVMLCPMVYSVGIQNKALEAMALGTPVVVAARRRGAERPSRARFADDGNRAGVRLGHPAAAGGRGAAARPRPERASLPRTAPQLARHHRSIGRGVRARH
ncbi:MAG: glycosyltransferase, partial [Chloroflexi bacterium]